MEGCTSTVAPLDLRKFASEIRELIFQRCINAKSNQSPRILIALRSDLELYYEALRVFYKLNFFVFNGFNILPSLIPLDKGIEGIRKLYIALDYTAGVLPERLFRAPIERLQMRSSSKKDLLSCSQKYVKKFAALKVLEFKLPLYKTRSDHLPSPRQGDIYEVIQAVNHHLGITGRLYRVPSGGSFELWTWEALNGKNLKWDD